MTREAILERFGRLNVWSRGGQRAPHKPLLILYALGRWSRGDVTAIPFNEIDPQLTDLLKEFGPSRRSYHPEYPFWRLQNDGVWKVHAPTGLKSRRSNTDPRKVICWRTRCRAASACSHSGQVLPSTARSTIAGCRPSGSNRRQPSWDSALSAQRTKGAWRGDAVIHRIRSRIAAHVIAPYPRSRTGCPSLSRLRRC